MSSKSLIWGRNEIHLASHLLEVVKRQIYSHVTQVSDLGEEPYWVRKPPSLGGEAKTLFASPKSLTWVRIDIELVSHLIGVVKW